MSLPLILAVLNALSHFHQLHVIKIAFGFDFFQFFKDRLLFLSGVVVNTRYSWCQLHFHCIDSRLSKEVLALDSIVCYARLLSWT